MYESVDVVGFSPSPSSPSAGSFLSVDYYHRPPGLGAEKGPLAARGRTAASVRGITGDQQTLEWVQPL
ncbi:unnamed protein product [Tetraodon nigroviridis]|uniref:(spotted green pufferfish) hypothetical protein n=1 Tax=Tetraodon nigroviridis TaxID=99883 RepID=Q4SBA3_TETNG|nr:unnamed protein product [Tetraodon nigroviridis]